MSPRDSFWFLAGALVSIAIMVSVRGWLRGRPALDAPRPSIPSFAVPVAAALALLGVAMGVYFLLGSPDPTSKANEVSATTAPAPAAEAAATGPMAQSTAAAGSMDEVTKRLAARLATKGGSDSEWNLLAQSYEYLGRADDAKAARAHSAVPVSGAAEISGTVDIVSQLAAQASPGATLFIYARQPNVPGPPLAAVRLRAERWPVSFTLTDTNSMVPGRKLSDADSVQIEARISRSGDAIQQAGDLVGTVTSVNPRGGRPVKISIDRKIG